LPTLCLEGADRILIVTMNIHTLKNQPRPARITAVLGPTNTGKTHLAIDRMMAHSSGMIGLPLRLLAREVYDRIVRIKGLRDVALITGEEKILPPRARYFVCTVEAMPLERPVEFLCVDEIQLAADRERGHTFTDRLLNARGLSETMVLGSETVRGLIQKLLPDTIFINRPRFSELTWTGSKKLTRLPRRSAIVAFSADQVYAIAELIRRQRGGAAVVMGALSPRTRNAQVALYQSGDVDFLVATDAVGMGLNMDVDHVAFAATTKFDGVQHRPLKISEIAQIAGRAGRHMNDGTFGITGDAAMLSDEVIHRVENHEFDAERLLQWRNPHPEFSSIAGLIKSLEVPPNGPDWCAQARATTSMP
jgi:ATP-dependent RNA helicase SUPV3L1/SUV3